MISLLPSGIIPRATRLLHQSSDTSIQRGTNSFQSITCVSSADPTEAFTIPANTLHRDGDEVLWEAFGELQNAEGNSRSLTPNVTIGGNLVHATSGSSIVHQLTSAGKRSWRLDIRLIRLSATNAYLIINQKHNNIAVPNVSVQGTPLGSLANSYMGEGSTAMIPFAADSAQTFLVTMAWSVTSIELWVNPRLRRMVVFR